MSLETIEWLLWIMALCPWLVAGFFAWRISRINRARHALHTGRDDKLLRSFRSRRP